MLEAMHQPETILPLQGDLSYADLTVSFRWRNAAQAAPIIERATEVIGTIGYGQASLRTIANGNGFSVASVYYYFRNKEELLFAIVERGLGGVLEHVEHKLAGVVTPQEKLLALVTGSLRYHCDNFRQFTVLFKESNNLSGSYAQIVQQLRNRYVACANAIIDDYLQSTIGGAGNVNLKHDEWRERHVYYLIGLISWTVMNRRRIQSTDAESLSPEFLGRELCELYLNGMVFGTRQSMARWNESRERLPTE